MAGIGGKCGVKSYLVNKMYAYGTHLSVDSWYGYVASGDGYRIACHHHAIYHIIMTGRVVTVRGGRLDTDAVYYT